MSDRARRRLCAISLALVASACEPTKTNKASPDPGGATSQRLYLDVTAEAGIDLVHANGATGRFYTPEIMGSGCALFDADGDGDLDLYVVQSAALGPASDAQTAEPNRLFRNELVERGDGVVRFTDITESSGTGHLGCGMGCATGDYDNDGDPDLYVTNFGEDVLYRNDGGGKFSDVTAEAGLEGRGWTTSAAFLDFDRDGLLDLYVAVYVDFSPARHRDCTRLGGQRDYCGPMSYAPVADRLYRNLGQGRFQDVSRRAAIDTERANGLGVLCADFDGDGWIDILVANDAMPNMLWINRQDGSFENRALLAGVAVNADGQSEAGMGIAVGDADRDGDLDIFLTHERDETNTLYVALGSGLFDDATARGDLAAASRTKTGFGCAWVDADGDGALDLAVANGAVRALADQIGTAHPYLQPDQIYLARGEGFAEATDGLPPSLAAGRGLATGDIDNDGDVDLVVSSNAGPLRVLLSEVPLRRERLHLRLVGTRSCRDAAGSLVSVELDDGSRIATHVGTDGSYLSASDPRRVIVWPRERELRSVTVRWTSGTLERFAAEPKDELQTLTEGAGERK